MGGPLRLVELSDAFDQAIVIGDVHGRADLLERMLLEAGDRQVLIVGDLCDRGPSTPQVFDLLIERRALGVRGNHEEWFTQWACGDGFDDFALSPMVGGRATLTSYQVPPGTLEEIGAQHERVPRAHAEYAKMLPHVLGVHVGEQAWWLIHAGLPPIQGDVPSTIQDWMRAAGSWLLWGGAPVEYRPNADRPVVMGHMRVPRPIDLGHVIALDTGCGSHAAGYLSALLLPERRFISIHP